MRGLVCNWDTINSLSWEDYDILAFNEVWKINDFENLKISDFNIKTVKLRDVTRGGGSIIYVRDNIKCAILETPFIEGVIESTGIKIGKFNFIQIYRPPIGDKNLFIEKLSEYIDNLKGEQILIGGDFNINNLVKNKWIDYMCNNYQLNAEISKPTRINS